MRVVFLASLCGRKYRIFRVSGGPRPLGPTSVLPWTILRVTALPRPQGGVGNDHSTLPTRLEHCLSIVLFFKLSPGKNIFSHWVNQDSGRKSKRGVN